MTFSLSESLDLFFRKGHKKIFKLRNEFQEFVIYLNLEFVFIFKDIHFKEQKCE